MLHVFIRSSTSRTKCPVMLPAVAVAVMQTAPPHAFLDSSCRQEQAEAAVKKAAEALQATFFAERDALSAG